MRKRTATLVTFLATLAIGCGGSMSTTGNGGNGDNGSGGSGGSGAGGAGGAGGGGATGGGGSGGSGGGVAGLVFGAYKDTSINMNWNTNVISTNVSGAATALATDLTSAGAKTVTLAFATGECGSENWGGVQGAAMATANVSLLNQAGIQYILSTGGAAGSFTCSSDAGMKTFIDRWMSAGLLGVDFDIEAGQSTQVIGDLVARIKAAHVAYPNLRFSLTLSTLGFDGSAATWPSYVTVDLMTMDYGSPSPGVCVVANAACQMGQSALQAAYNLHDHWGVPWSNIELTPMIGGNDVAGEQFTLADADAVASFAKQQKLAGVHHWSYDRDVDCPAGSASPTCNSIGNAGTRGYLKRFLAAGL